jgi:hypothetical protein
MNSDYRNLSITRIAGCAVDFLVIVVPIALTVIVTASVTVAILPEFSLAVLASAVILAPIRWLNIRHDQQRAIRYVQVPDFRSQDRELPLARRMGGSRRQVSH